MRYRVLLVDDEIDNHFLNQSILENAEDNDFQFLVEECYSADEAEKKVRRCPWGYAVVVLDIQMPVRTGIDLARSLREINGNINIIFHTARMTTENLKEICESGGAIRIIRKDSPDVSKLLVGAVKTACRDWDEKDRTILDETRVRNKNQALLEKVEMIGSSNALAQVARSIIKYADAKDVVLVEGESGTGKELVAKALHSNSVRRDRLFIPLNCSTFHAEQTALSELFGHTRGAFTGAVSDRLGVFESAKGGTVFLDEIDLLRKDVQQVLLRTLQEKTVRRLGEVGERKTDFRLIVAAKPDLKRKVDQGQFHEDLFFRLNVLSIRVPPLRERLEDLPELVEHFNEKWINERGIKRYFLQSTLRLLRGYWWRGNVRELETFLRRALEDCEDTASRVRPEQVDIQFQSYLGNDYEKCFGSSSLHQNQNIGFLTKQDFDREVDRKLSQFYRHHLRQNSGKVKPTAESIGMDRKTFTRDAQRLGVISEGRASL